MNCEHTLHCTPAELFTTSTMVLRWLTGSPNVVPPQAWPALNTLRHTADDLRLFEATGFQNGRQGF